MIRDPGQLAVYVRPGLTDMRKQINGLAIIAEEEMRLDPLQLANVNSPMETPTVSRT